MFHPDTDVSRQLVREHQAELTKDWQWVNPAQVNPAQPDVVKSSRRHWRFRLDWLRTHVRPTSQAS